jgi:hypothetical protein
MLMLQQFITFGIIGTFNNAIKIIEGMIYFIVIASIIIRSSQ